MSVAGESSGHDGAVVEAPAVVIMAGGAGTRFWPASTEERPKQFLRLLGGQSLLQESYERALLLTSRERVLVLTGRRLVSLVREQLPDLSAGQVIGEPVRRDTAAAVCLAALIAQSRFGECVVVTLTSDHHIEPAEEFVRTMSSVVEAAAGSSALYTLGVRPTYPATGYGYLERGAPVVDSGGAAHFGLLRFREKPDRKTAEEFVASGGFLWNSGMFVWSAAAILDRFEQYLPRHVEALRPVLGADGRLDETALERAFADLVPISVDYGIMEKATGARVVEASFSWSDIGGWEALSAFLPDDGAGNRGTARIASLAAEGNVVFSEDAEELVALVGVSGLAVVRAGKRTLVVPLERAEEVKELVKNLGGQDT
ncbi:MAG: NTP transferase domain-containing protein [Actinobacteria bacterium]|nr:NTP transferase domain-containing protein [Actinomycetota bacterium]